MREIKLRAWQTNFKEMHQPLCGYIELPDVVVGFSDGDLRLEGDGVVLMQYTGIRDKNGNDIYEGDIVEAWDNGLKATFEVRYRIEGAPMYILWPDYQENQFWNLHGPQDTSLEVIGNIYESPELVTNLKTK